MALLVCTAIGDALAQGPVVLRKHAEVRCAGRVGLALGVCPSFGGGESEIDHQVGSAAPRPRQVEGIGAYVSKVFGDEKESVGGGTS